MCWGRLVRCVEVNGKYPQWTGCMYLPHNGPRKTQVTHGLTNYVEKRQEMCFEKNHGEVDLVSSGSSPVEELGSGLPPVSQYRLHLSVVFPGLVLSPLGETLQNTEIVLLMEVNDVINKWINKDVLINLADFKYQGLTIITIFLHGLGRLTCSGMDALPSYPGASTILEVCS